jgi:hypothetical protein
MIREAVTAFARRKGGGDGKEDTGPVAKVDPDDTGGETKPGTKVDVVAKVEGETKPVAKPEPEVAAAEPDPEPRKLEPPAVTAESPRVRQATLVPFTEPPVGKPPAMPDGPRTERPSMGAVEDPTRMPTSREIPDGNPEDPAAPPGYVPPGDSRSLRRGNDFALVYRQATFVITRFGVVGQRGQWRVVEYPTSASASHSYAKECSRFVSEGFSDYRA